MSKRRRTLLIELALYGVFVGLVGLWPTPVERGAAPVIVLLLAVAQVMGAPSWFDHGFIQTLTNIALFVPFGVLVAAYLSPRRSWWAPILGTAVSVLIETVQFLLLPERYPTPDDVIANAIGAAFGTLAVYAWRTEHPPSHSE